MAVVENGVKSNLGMENGSMNRGSEITETNNNNDDNNNKNHNREMRELEEMLSKLNPCAQEFVPPSLLTNNNHPRFPASFHPPTFFGPTIDDPSSPFRIFPNQHFPNQFPNHNLNNQTIRKKKSSYGQGRRRMNNRTGMAQRDEVIRRTVYVSDIDQQVTEEQLASLFINYGHVVDCRICGDPNSVLRFAFVEFTDADGAMAALSLSGTMLGFYPIKVLPSKTAIAPVNPTYLPQNDDEREMCARTIYCTNIDKKVPQTEIKLFFESVCGEVHRLRMLGDNHHSTRIAFVEFVKAESAIAALNCSGILLGNSAIRVSPSKTPVRPRATRKF